MIFYDENTFMISRKKLSRFSDLKFQRQKLSPK